MESARPLPWWRRILLLSVVGWTFIVGVNLYVIVQGKAGQSLWIVHEDEAAQTANRERFRAWFGADVGFQRFYPWVLLGPYVALIAWHFPLESGRFRLSLPLNLMACLVFISASHAINARTRMTVTKFRIVKSDPAQGGLQTSTIRNISGPALTNMLVQLNQGFKPPGNLPGMPNSSVWSALLDLLAYAAVVGLAHSVHFYRRFRERERRALLLESNLAGARLNALRAQLQPHFLFNSLNAIAALLRRDPRLAEATLMSLSDLLRIALSQSEMQEVVLREEMQFVLRYLEIQQTRFGDKLRVEQDIEPAAMDCFVPTLLLQPLVENAIRHGIEPAEKAGLVRLTAHQRAGSLVLTVEDNGAGLNTELREAKSAGFQTGATSSPNATSTALLVSVAQGGTGIGLTNLRARLEALYGAGQSLELAPRPDGGVNVRIEIPWRTVTVSEPPAASTLS